MGLGKGMVEQDLEEIRKRKKLKSYKRQTPVRIFYAEQTWLQFLGEGAQSGVQQRQYARSSARSSAMTCDFVRVQPAISPQGLARDVVLFLVTP